MALFTNSVDELPAQIAAGVAERTEKAGGAFTVAGTRVRVPSQPAVTFKLKNELGFSEMRYQIFDANQNETELCSKIHNLVKIELEKSIIFQ